MRWLPLLLITAGLYAQEPQETPKPQEEPRKQEAPRKPPVAAPLPKVQGLSDDFPIADEKYLPEYKGETIAPPKETAQPEKKPDESPKGPGFLAGLLSGDKTFLNVLILCLLVGIFVLYRLRGRK